MILVDTSVWIDFLAGKASPQADRLAALLLGPEDLGLTGMILTEVLQGVRSDRAWREVLVRVAPFSMIEPAREDYLEAARIYRRCRQRGVTVRSTIDCLIAALCLNRNGALLHRDRDYDGIARITGLRVVA